MLKTVSSIVNAIGALNYKGTWDANTNTPTLVSSVGTKGDYYVVSVAGSTNLNGETNWGVGDWAVFNGSVWQKVDGGSTGNFTDITVSNSATLSYGTANGVAYLNASKVLTTGSGFTFSGSALGLPSASVSVGLNTSGQFIDVINGDSTNAQRLRLTTSGTDGVIQVTRSAGTVPNLIFRQDASELMRLTSTGLGIGTSSPAYKLDVQGGGGAAARIRASSAYAGLLLSSQDSNAGTRNWIVSSNWNTYGDFALVQSNAQNGDPITAGTTRLAIDSSGNVGIGTSSPTRKLSVYDTTSIPVRIETNTSDTKIEILTTSGTQFVQGSANNLLFGTNNIERVRIDSAGNVGIGTSSLGARLDVRGASTDIGFRYIETTTGNTNRIQLGAVSGAGYIDVTAGIGLPSLQLRVVGTTQATLDSSGNLGLGVTPSAWNSAYKALDIGNSLGMIGSGSAADLYFNAFLNSSSNFVYKQTATASAYSLANGQHRWYTAPSGTAGNTISFTQAMTLDANGNLNLGVTSTQGGRFSVVAAASQPYSSFDAPTAGYAYSVLKYNGAAFGYIGQASAIVTGGANTDYALQATGNLLFATGGATERARIPSTGGFVVGTAALATNATTGFLYVPTCAGTPTGTPATQTGTAPIVVDTTNNKLYFYSGGQWRDAGP